MRRRTFLQAMVAALTTATLGASERRQPRILLRSSWQMVNIGDIAHTGGVLALLEKHLPEAEVVLWASESHSPEVAAMERRRFPGLRIVKGNIADDGRASNDELSRALAETDFLLHGSGPSLVAARDVNAFVKHFGKPFGVYGITYGGGNAARQTLMGKAEFLFFRDSVSLGVARKEGIACPIMEFGPDGAFAFDITNDEAADRFLHEKKLEPGRFLCCIPRLRYTPYWRIHDREMSERDRRRRQRNRAMAEHDHAPLRKAITALVRDEGYKVLVCPEDMSQMQVGKQMILDKLPDDVRRGVAWREHFWLPDEAVSVYRRAAGLFGLEMHSPIMCIGNGTPAIVCRFPEQTSKGFMWRDIGLDDWLFNMDKPEQVANLTETVLDLVRKPDQTRNQVAAAQEIVTKRQQATMDVLREHLA